MQERGRHIHCLAPGMFQSRLQLGLLPFLLLPCANALAAHPVPHGGQYRGASDVQPPANNQSSSSSSGNSTNSGSQGSTGGSAPTSNFSGLVSSTCALARADASTPMELLARFMAPPRRRRAQT